MGSDEVLVAVRSERVAGVRVRVRLPDARPDESTFFLLALAFGALCGYLVAVVR